MRLIDADALKDKLQQHHDFYVMAWGGFGKMPIGEKKRVDEITNCIAEVVNAPTIEPKRGEWIYGEHDVAMCDGYRCDRCGLFVPWDYEHKSIDFINDYHFCPNCGADMRNCSEKPNNCETCRFELYCPEMCEGCCEWDSHYEPKDEPQIEVCVEVR